MNITNALELLPLAEKPSFFSVAQEYLKKPAGVNNLLLRPVIHIVNWAEWAQGCISEGAKELRDSFKRANCFFEGLDFPSKLFKLKIAVDEFVGVVGKDQPVLTIADKASAVFTSFTNPMVYLLGVTKIMEKDQWISFSPFQRLVFDTLGFVGSVGLLIKSMKDFVSQITVLQGMQSTDPEFSHRLVKLISKIAHLAIAILGMITFTYGAETIPKALALTVSSLFLITTIVAHFLKEINVPKDEILPSDC